MKFRRLLEKLQKIQIANGLKIKEVSFPKIQQAIVNNPKIVQTIEDEFKKITRVDVSLRLDKRRIWD